MPVQAKYWPADTAEPEVNPEAVFLDSRSRWPAAPSSGLLENRVPAAVAPLAKFTWPKIYKIK